MNSLNHVPNPSDQRIAIHVKPAAERAIRQGHPWLFDHSLRKQSHSGTTGDLAVIFDKRDRFLAIGLFDAISPIRVRILQHRTPSPINRSWFQKRLRVAIKKRDSITQTITNGYRLVHGENDYLPGLVIDRYAESLVMRIDTAAWIPHLATLIPALLEIIPSNQLLLRLSRNAKKQDELLHGLSDGQLLWGQHLENPVTFQENSFYFEADMVRGQKTGFYLDQRENRARVEDRVNQGKLVRVLNVFAYTGGFSLYAARGGAEKIVSVDSSRQALLAAERNFELNQRIRRVASADHHTIAGDSFQVLEQLNTSGQVFDLVVIDPPSFAKSRSEVTQAKKSYAYLVRLGISVLRSRGQLVMSSCSSRVNEATFRDVVLTSAKRLGRPVIDVESTAHPLDHPASFPEGAYLKCLFCVVS
jgi:23S rRNA (cytosine1962-C5)-methyltransferase